MQVSRPDGEPIAAMLFARDQFIHSLAQALECGIGFAAGKFGYAEQVWLAAPAYLTKAPNDIKFQRAAKAASRFHAEQQLGIFPTTEAYLSSFRNEFIQSAASLDYLAMFQSPLSSAALECLPALPRVISFNDLEPNRDVPYQAADCYLPFLSGRRLLLITSPAELLASRATEGTFESVWANINCPWFSPASVEPLAFPSLFDAQHMASRATSLDLLSEVCKQVAATDFDIALIAASSLGIPIASYVKSLGKVGISLGGHLQVVFGVQGKRWRDDPEWQDTYWNDSWIDMPIDFTPQGRRWLVDDGAYW